jgi:hypothetical protein
VERPPELFIASSAKRTTGWEIKCTLQFPEGGESSSCAVWWKLKEFVNKEL